jgi:plasmid stability protein
VAVLTIRKLDESLKTKLRIRAAANGRSMEEEARAILRITLTESEPPEKEHWVDSIRRRVERVGGVDLEIPPRDMPREVPDFE